MSLSSTSKPRPLAKTHETPTIKSPINLVKPPSNKELLKNKYCEKYLASQRTNTWINEVDLKLM